MTSVDLRKTYPILRYFDYSHLPESLRERSKLFYDVAWIIAGKSPNNAETATALRKLLEAKDCAVRAILPEPV